MYETAEGIDSSEVEEVLPFDVNADVIEIEDDDYGLFYMDAMDNPSKYAGKKINDSLKKNYYFQKYFVMQIN